jgi:putative alpha-1,2-mannosidase
MPTVCTALRWSALLFAAAGTSALRLVGNVDTLIGTGGAGFGIGSINPGPQVPFGAMRLGPDTIYVDPLVGPLWLRWNHFGGYYYNDTSISCFSHTHMVGPVRISTNLL